jgi:hypothetical protein
MISEHCIRKQIDQFAILVDIYFNFFSIHRNNQVVPFFKLIVKKLPSSFLSEAYHTAQ